MKAKIYTKLGDKGQTSLVGGTRVSKSDPRLSAYGTVDELNSALGLLVAFADESPSQLGFCLTRLSEIQHTLFNLGSQLACESQELKEKMPAVSADLIVHLETDMDAWDKDLKELKNFILPGGSKASAQAHICRTLCRRAEREAVALTKAENENLSSIILLNRLSDWMFVLARRINLALGVPDVIWKP